MSVLQVLFQGRTRVAEIGWTQGAHARNGDGKPHRFDWKGQPLAASYSAQGGVAGNDVLDMMHARIRLWDALGERQLGYGNLADWNDDPARTQAEVVELYEAAIAQMVA